METYIPIIFYDKFSIQMAKYVKGSVLTYFLFYPLLFLVVNIKSISEHKVSTFRFKNKRKVYRAIQDR